MFLAVVNSSDNYVCFSQESPGGAADFPDGLKVGIYQESVPMGMDPNKISYKEAGNKKVVVRHTSSDYEAFSQKSAKGGQEGMAPRPMVPIMAICGPRGQKCVNMACTVTPAVIPPPPRPHI